MPGPFVHPLRVRYHECDPQGVVFNANYFAYFDIALTELWREAFGSYQAMLDAGHDLVVAEATARFRAAARFDDEIEVAIAVERLGTTSMTSGLEIRRDGEVLVEGRMVHVFVTAGTADKAPIPDAVRERLAGFATAAAH